MQRMQGQQVSVEALCCLLPYAAAMAQRRRAPGIRVGHEGGVVVDVVFAYLTHPVALAEAGTERACAMAAALSVRIAESHGVAELSLLQTAGAAALDRRRRIDRKCCASARQQPALYVDAAHLHRKCAVSQRREHNVQAAVALAILRLGREVGSVVSIEQQLYRSLARRVKVGRDQSCDNAFAIQERMRLLWPQQNHVGC